MSGVVPMLVGPADEEYWTPAEAAEKMDVKPATIASWRRKGYLRAHPKSPRNRPLYRDTDVCAAERMAFQAAMRTSGSPKRTSRPYLAA